MSAHGEREVALSAHERCSKFSIIVGINFPKLEEESGFVILGHCFKEWKSKSYMLEKILLTQKYSFVKSVHMCACICKLMCLCVHKYVCVCSWDHVGMHMWKCEHMSFCVCIVGVHACMCVCGYMCVIVYVSTCKYTCLCMWVCLSMWLYAYACVSVSVCICVIVCAHACVCEMRYVCVPCLDSPALSSQQGGHTVYVSLIPELCVSNLKINPT